MVWTINSPVSEGAFHLWVESSDPEHSNTLGKSLATDGSSAASPHSPSCCTRHRVTSSHILWAPMVTGTGCYRQGKGSSALPGSIAWCCPGLGVTPACPSPVLETNPMRPERLSKAHVRLCSRWMDGIKISACPAHFRKIKNLSHPYSDWSLISYVASVTF